MTRLTEEWRSRIGSFLDGCVSMTVSTVSPNGSPRAADVYFVSDRDLNLYFYSDPASRHSRNIARDKRVAVAIRKDSMDWHEIRGVQIEGSTAVVTDSGQRSEAWRLMCAKFPFYESFTDVVEHLEIYRVTPRWLRWTDNSLSFGHHEEFSFDEG